MRELWNDARSACRRDFLANSGLGFGSLAPGLLAYSVARSTAVAAAALVLIGAGYFCVLVSGQALLQLDAPVALRARVMALFSIALGLPYVVAVTVHGFVGDAWGLRETHGVMAAITTLVGLLLFRRVPLAEAASSLPTAGPSK